MDKLSGGTILPIGGFFVGSGGKSHTAEQRGRPVSMADIGATNRLQETGRRINRGLLEVAQAAFSSSHPCIDLNALIRPDPAPKLPKDEWDALDRAGRSKVAKDRRDARQALQTWRGEVCALAELLEIARRDADAASLYTVIGHDARLRRYPRVSGGPSPQGDSLSRGLLMFDEGVEVGASGLWWLMVRAGTAAGLDKLPHAERAAWVKANAHDLFEAARRPLEVDFWWRDASGKRRDDPWALLATAMELEALTSSSNPHAFLSHLPVHVDGTCNGLQHLSAMGLDPVGALATNLTSASDRHDIYEIVAAKVREKVDEDAAAGLDVARGWQGNVERDTVKRACMTTPYGVTARGMRDQLIDDEKVSAEDHEDVSAAAGYLRDVLWDAIGATVVSARNIMDWLQTVAGTLAQTNIPMTWTTPAGSSIRQAYRPWTVSRPLTAFGRVNVAGEIDKSSLKVRKCALGAAPNYVHSFDAAHMALTVNAAADLGLTHFDTIHDSYGCHAAHMDTLNGCIRQEFVSIYKEDWLSKTYEGLRQAHPRITLPLPPPRGEFDVSQVLESPWFFA